ncbi:MAG TPA: ABC transporter permease [Chthoniobacterales bacterium]|jgi:putative ABC transport system permease protein|nr:ABC transporter permease [Chthoniobacterales bacterium]HEV3098807.1 ABC transporter permease [Candidatus Udaeobacter sp.]
MNDLGFAFRKLRQSPAFTLIAVITLALGIGANTAIFSIVNAVLLRPLPYPNADRIMVLNESSGPGQDYSVALPDYFDWRNDNTVFEHLAATHKESRNLSGIPGREPERVSCASVTRNFFNIIGLPPELGRTFTEDEDKVGGPPVVVISDRLWQHAFNRDRGVIGRSINLHDQNFTIIGVMPPQVRSPQDSDAWFSLMRRSNNPAWMDRSHHPMIFVWGKLKAGASVDQARTEMKGIAARLEKTYPDTNGKVYAVVTPLLENLVGKYRTNLVLLLGAVGLVLLIACANLANLFAARGAARAREFAIYSAVGATRGQIIRKLLLESFLIAILGGALGFIIAIWLRDALIALGPEGVSRFQQISFDLPVLGFTFLIASLTTVLFGLWPAWQASHVNLQLALKAGSAGSGDPPSAKRARDWLVISEIALTLTLLVAAGLVVKSFSRLQSLSLGYEPRALFTARFELPWRKYNNRDKIDIFAKALLDKVRALPGVQNVAVSSNGPLMGGWQTGFWREENPRPQPSDMLNSDLEVVGGDYFSTLKVPLLRGRTFNERDTKDSPRVIIIDQAMAEQYFPGEDPIGKRLGVDVGNDEEGWVMSEIVGVVARMRFHAVDEMAPLPLIYCSLGQAQRTGLTLFVRSTIASAVLERSILEAVTSIDSSLAVFDARPMSDRVRETWGAQRLLSFLFSIFAGLALVLATIGLYGLLAYTTLKRVPEIGIRLALGARPAQIRALIVSHAMHLLLIGSMIGLVAAVALSRALQTVLFEVKGIDPRIYLGVGALLFSATLFAAWIPARRASRVDPMIALRTE